ncbi:MAG: nuclear transport factor 2 family protein [Myxococcota bacterium]
MERHPHTGIAYGLWAAIAAGDPLALAGLLDEKCTWHMPGRSPLAGDHEGIEGVTAFMARVGELSDELVAELRDVFVSDRGAVLHYTLEARRGSELLETEHLFRVRIENDRVTEGHFAPLDQESYDRFWRYQ